MDTVKRTCVKDLSMTDKEGNVFTLEKGREYLTSKVGQAAAAHGPGPEQGHVVVFSSYWVSVPVELFDCDKEIGN